MPRSKIHRAKLTFLPIVAILAAAGCADFDKNRTVPDRGSLGQEMFAMVCDRVGAQALREDITGASYHDVCHGRPDGTFADTVDTTKLEPLDPAARDVDGNPVSMADQQKHRAYRISRVESLARHRADLGDAFDFAFADAEIDRKDLTNPDATRSCDTPADGTAKGALRSEVADMLGRLTDLYDDDTIPNLTRGFSRVTADVGASPDALAALARFDAHRGYRPLDVAMGPTKPLLAYPRLVELANAVLANLSSDTDPHGLLHPDAPKKKMQDRVASDRFPGPGHAAMSNLFAAMREELRTAPVATPLPELAVSTDAQDPKLTLLSRPRGNLELLRTILLEQDSSFSHTAPFYVTRRDTRGIAKVALVDGKVPAPFVDADGDGLADVDALGQFVGNALPTPFRTLIADPAGITRDESGRPLLGSRPTYETVDVSTTYLSQLARDLVPLLDPNPGNAHETIMDLLGGLVVVAGERDDGAAHSKTYGDVTLNYRGFKEDKAPLVDLVYGVGQVLADPTTDDTLALAQRIATDKPELLARIVGAGLRIKAIADRHPEAHVPADSSFWDDMLDVFVEISQNPTLLEDMFRAFGEDATLRMPDAAIPYLTMRDQLSYDRANLNGAPYNITTKRVESLRTPVDRTKPDSSWNRSAFQRFLQTLHDTNGLSTCTKQGAVAHIVWNGLALDFPSFGASAACTILGAPPPPNPMPLCGMFRIKDVASDIIDGFLGTVQLDIRDPCLQAMVSSPLTGIVGGADAFLENISGIQGWNLHPTVPAVSRMVFFDLPHDADGGDTQNPKTLNFFRDLFEPTPTTACAPFTYIDKDGSPMNLRKCNGFQYTLRDRDQDALFPLEELGFVDSAKPLARAFQKNGANLLFVRLFDALHMHWGSTQQIASECDKSLPKSDARWCAQDGLVTYEPLLAEVMASGLFPALHDATRELAQMQIPHCQARDKNSGACTKSTTVDGVKVLAEAVKAMVDPKHNPGLKQRNGDAGVTRNDGSRNNQVTPIYLLADAMRDIDKRLADDHAATGNDRTPSWRRGRSQLVDQLFAVDGSGQASHFRNASVVRMMPLLIGTLRSQILANCHDPSANCDWGRVTLPNKAKDMILGPEFAAALDTFDAIRSDEKARTELERLFQYLLAGTDNQAAKSSLSSIVDLLSFFEDDPEVTALLHAAADAAGPEVLDDKGHVASRGLLLSSIETMSRVLAEVHQPDGTRICSKEIDPNRTLQIVLQRLIAIRSDGKPTALDVMSDVIADVNRVSPAETKKLDAADYGNVAREVSDFCGNPASGLEQVYTVIKQATKNL